MIALISALLFSPPTFAEDPVEPGHRLGCVLGMVAAAKEAYAHPDRFETPIFDAATDEKILALAPALENRETLKRVAPAEIESLHALLADKAKDVQEACLTFSRARLKACGGDLDPNCKKWEDTADVQLLYVESTEKIRAQFLRVRGATPPAEPWSAKFFRFPYLYGLIGFAWLAFFLFVARLRIRKARSCPVCQSALPTSRFPTDFYEAFVGGWTCQKCGTKLTYNLKKRS